MRDDAAASGAAGPQPGASEANSVHLTFVVRNDQVVAFQVGRRSVAEDAYTQLVRAIDAALAERVVMVTNVNRMRNRTVYAMKPGIMTKAQIAEMLRDAATPLEVGVDDGESKDLRGLGHARAAAPKPGSDNGDEEIEEEEEED